MSVLIKDMEMPKECHGCRWFYFQGTSCTEPKYYLDARCELVESGQDWYGKDSRGGWVGESIEHIPGWTGYYSYKHCVEYGTRASQCPLCELPSAQPEPSEITDEQAIMHLQSTGWMQNHDREMYESGLRERLADDSDSYDALLPSAQPEVIRCKDCKYFELDRFEKVDWFPIPINVAHEICMKWGEGCRTSIDGWCFMAERRTDEQT